MLRSQERAAGGHRAPPRSRRGPASLAGWGWGWGGAPSTPSAGRQRRQQRHERSGLSPERWLTAPAKLLARLRPEKPSTASQPASPEGAAASAQGGRAGGPKPGSPSGSRDSGKDAPRSSHRPAARPVPAGPWHLQAPALMSLLDAVQTAARVHSAHAQKARHRQAQTPRPFTAGQQGGPLHMPRGSATHSSTPGPPSPSPSPSWGPAAPTTRPTKLRRLGCCSLARSLTLSSASDGRSLRPSPSRSAFALQGRKKGPPRWPAPHLAWRRRRSPAEPIRSRGQGGWGDSPPPPPHTLFPAGLVHKLAGYIASFLLTKKSSA